MGTRRQREKGSLPRLWSDLLLPPHWTPSRALERVPWKSKDSHHKEYAQRRFMNEIFNPVPEDANRPLKVNSKADRVSVWVKAVMVLAKAITELRTLWGRHVACDRKMKRPGPNHQLTAIQVKTNQNVWSADRTREFSWFKHGDIREILVYSFPQSLSFWTTEGTHSFTILANSQLVPVALIVINTKNDYVKN